MTISIDEVAKQFTKKELHAIAGELAVEVQLGTNSKALVDAIIKSLDTDGVPEFDDCSDTLAEFLLAAEYIDEEGNLLEEETDEDVIEEEAVKPECFGYQDDRDPACERCKVLSACKKEKARTRPECFGVRYKVNDPECQICLEYGECKGAKK